MTQPSVAAIIVAAGRSERFGQPAKVLAPLLGRPVLEWSLRAHGACELVTELVIVGQAPDREQISRLADRSLAGRTPWRLVEGGDSRTHSVLNGLSAVSASADLVSIHDAARPGVTASLISAVARKAADLGAAVAGLPARDTIKLCSKDGLVRETLDRSCLWQVATPQVFRRQILLEAYKRVGTPVTDDASLVEAMGQPVAVVAADERIAKITTRQDLRALEGMLSCGPTRIGFGYDIHPVQAARDLFLGGVHFPEGPGLDGHSDADVVCHAAADALLGAAALGDIGRHFPNTDPAYAGISSIELLRSVCGMLAAHGYVVLNLDITLIAERPKIVSRSQEMTERMAGALGIEADQVSVKATTSEKIGPAGEGRCMEAHAVAQIARECLNCD